MATKRQQQKLSLKVGQVETAIGTKTTTTSKRYHLANWFDGPNGGARAKTNIPGMQCPRCATPLEADVEHTCGNLKGITPL